MIVLIFLGLWTFGVTIVFVKAIVTACKKRKVLIPKRIIQGNRHPLATGLMALAGLIIIIPVMLGIYWILAVLPLLVGLQYVGIIQ